MRRDFLKSVLAGTAAWIAAPREAIGRETALRGPSPGPENPDFIPILQGATTPTTAQFSLLVLDDPRIRLEIAYVDGSPAFPSIRLSHARHDGSRWIAIRAKVTGLEPGRDAVLRVFDAGGKLLDSRVFATLKDVAPAALRFVVASCMNDAMIDDAKSMWEALETARPDYLFLTGDSVYVDSGPWSIIDGKRIWRRYVETRMALGLYRWKRLVPTIVTWDDHDFGKNDKDSRWGMKDVSRAVFDAMYAQDATDDGLVSEGPGIARGVSVYGHRFLLTDGRSFRSGRWAREKNETFWGVEQDRWMDDVLRSSDQPLWLMNGTQFFGGYRGGLTWSFEGNHAHRFRDFIDRMRRIEAPVILCSGDVHFSEVQEIEPEIFGYGTYEITSSAMHSFTRSLPEGSARRMAATNFYNFCLIEATAAGREVGFDVTCVGAGGREHFKLRDLVVGRR